jgi:hypothetical protein
MSVSYLCLGRNYNGYLYFGTKSTGYLYFGRPTINGYLYLGTDVDTTLQRYGIVKINQLPDHADMIPILDKYLSISFRSYYWKYHIEKSMSGAKVFMFGSSQRTDRQTMHSAHNYYIDLLYNFGFISLLPMIVIIGLTIVWLYRYRIRVILSSEIFCLAFVVMFLLLINNSLSVGLRQPYPGVFTFFIWGILLSKLEKMKSGHMSEQENSINKYEI